MQQSSPAEPPRDIFQFSFFGTQGEKTCDDDVKTCYFLRSFLPGLSSYRKWFVWPMSVGETLCRHVHGPARRPWAGAATMGRHGVIVHLILARVTARGRRADCVALCRGPFILLCCYNLHSLNSAESFRWQAVVKPAKIKASGWPSPPPEYSSQILSFSFSCFLKCTVT